MRNVPPGIHTIPGYGGASVENTSDVFAAIAPNLKVCVVDDVMASSPALPPMNFRRYLACILTTTVPNDSLRRPAKPQPSEFQRNRNGRTSIAVIHVSCYFCELTYTIGEEQVAARSYSQVSLWSEYAKSKKLDFLQRGKKGCGKRALPEAVGSSDAGAG
jgi:hypothetical protein